MLGFGEAWPAALAALCRHCALKIFCRMSNLGGSESPCRVLVLLGWSLVMHVWYGYGRRERPRARAAVVGIAHCLQCRRRIVEVRGIRVSF